MPDDPIDLFASLRPDDDTLTAADREGIWAELTGQGQATAPDEANEVPVADRSMPRGEHRRALSIAAAAVLVLAVLVVATRRGGRELGGGVEPSTISGSSATTSLEPAVASSVQATPAVTSSGASLPVATSSPAANDLAGPGKLILDSLPAGWSFVSSDDRQTITNTKVVMRVYATASSQPEKGPSLTLTAGDPPEGEPANAVDINGAKGGFVNVGKRIRRLSFGPVAGLWATLDATGIDDAALITIAKTVSAAPDGAGLSISPASLPPGVRERAAGYRSDRGLVPFPALALPIPTGFWVSQHTYVRYWSMEATADTLPIYRIRLDDVHDATVQGVSGFAGSSGAYSLVGWAEGDRLYLVESNTSDGVGSGLSPTDLVGHANRLRPATLAEWSVASASTAENDLAGTTTTVRTG